MCFTVPMIQGAHIERAPDGTMFVQVYVPIENWGAVYPFVHNSLATCDLAVKQLHSLKQNQPPTPADETTPKNRIDPNLN